ncbi:hypothetical protein P0W64_09210 [Tsukamurella sp. 8F]|uniref:MutS-related protein n=1 Tax=unclassified Tsukamurella TaxID=2633480 RepID=UPI0023B99979|nr:MULTISPECIES: hypothetical protein [unclassified Tsukamurella]MDF0531910.1 hypothetical protein [Tsukamurella sp. 8J]MDF0586950.1 hypothetical protein [Tsukamurella sp. 8F]
MFESLLEPDGVPLLPPAPPPFFADLGLDRLFAAVCESDPETASCFWAPARTAVAVAYRQGVYRDLDEDPDLVARLRTFCATMADMRASDRHAATLPLRPERESWALHAVRRYLEAITDLRSAIAEHRPSAKGLRALGDHLDALTASAAFGALAHDATDIATQLDEIEYCLHVKGSDVRVSRYRDEPDFGAEVAAVFDRFRVEAPARPTPEPPPRPGLDGVEAAVLDRVTALFPDTFRALARFRERHDRYADPVIVRVDVEIRCYLASLDFVGRMRTTGLPWSMPSVDDGACTRASGLYDAAMAMGLTASGGTVVGNDVGLGEDERVLVVTGPNHAGKTCLARAFGQLHYLASLGLPVPATAAEVGVADAFFTRFERRESADDHRSRLEEDISEMRGILSAATGSSVVVMNETFTSTSLSDGIRLGTAVVQRLVEIGARCVYVTFVDEIAGTGAGVVSLAAEPGADPTDRTYRLRRRAPSGLAHADSLARRHRLDYAALRERVGS